MTKARVYNLRSRKTPNLAIIRLVILLVAISLIFLWTTAPTMKLINERFANQNLKLQYKSKLAQNKELKSEIKKLKTFSYIELKAREDLGLVKEGEIQYYVVLKKAKAKPKAKVKPKNWMEKTLNFLEVTFVK